MVEMPNGTSLLASTAQSMLRQNVGSWVTHLRHGDLVARDARRIRQRTEERDAAYAEIKRLKKGREMQAVEVFRRLVEEGLREAFKDDVAQRLGCMAILYTVSENTLYDRMDKVAPLERDDPPVWSDPLLSLARDFLRAMVAYDGHNAQFSWFWR